MALDLVKESQNFIIPHKPKEALKIRVGIHTGENISNVNCISALFIRILNILFDKCLRVYSIIIHLHNGRLDYSE